MLWEVLLDSTSSTGSRNLFLANPVSWIQERGYALQLSTRLTMM
jgi:hypothetical protein